MARRLKKTNKGRRSGRVSKLVMNPLGVDRSGYSWLTGPYTKKNSGVLKLRYSSFFDITVDATQFIPIRAVFRCNNMFDPDFTGVGHQPMGFDEVSAAFNRYTVLSSRMKATIMNDKAGNVMFGINQYTSSSVTPALLELSENKRGVQVMLSHLGDSHTKSLVSRYDTRKFNGIKRSENILGSQEYSGKADGTENPAEVAFWHLWVAPLESGIGGPVNVSVEIEYTCIWNDPARILLS